jgi:hypothetical protein
MMGFAALNPSYRLLTVMPAKKGMNLSTTPTSS